MAIAGTGHTSLPPIRWLHISDLHIRTDTVWDHDPVLKALCTSVAQNRTDGFLPDFILVTGDLAYSGKREEYALVGTFLEALCQAAGIPKEKMFLIPGNHDIQRGLSRMCVLGARTYTSDASLCAHLLSLPDETSGLLLREDNFREFQKTFLAGQTRQSTPDGLGYVSNFAVNDVRISVLGLDSSWLCSKSNEDQGRLLISETQVAAALELSKESAPHITVAMAHHPCRWLKEFDRQTVERLVDRDAHFCHSGHLHEPEARLSGQCLYVSAGATYETRLAQNSYSKVVLDFDRAVREVYDVRYVQRGGAFSAVSSNTFPFEISSSISCGIAELAEAISTRWASTSQFAYYLAAVLLAVKQEVIIPTTAGHTPGSPDVLWGQPASDLQMKTRAFIGFRNPLRLFSGRLSLADLLTKHGQPVRDYGEHLESMSKSDASLRGRLISLEDDARALAAAREPATSYLESALEALARENNWSGLLEHGNRHIDALEGGVQIKVRRLLANAYAGLNDHDRAIAIHRSLLDGGVGNDMDRLTIATLLHARARYEEAMSTVLEGISHCRAEALNNFREIGMRIAGDAGSRDYRTRLDAALETRRTHG